MCVRCVSAIGVFIRPARAEGAEVLQREAKTRLNIYKASSACTGPRSSAYIVLIGKRLALWRSFSEGEKCKLVLKSKTDLRSSWKMECESHR